MDQCSSRVFVRHLHHTSAVRQAFLTRFNCTHIYLYFTDTKRLDKIPMGSSLANELIQVGIKIKQKWKTFTVNSTETESRLRVKCNIVL